MSGQPAGRAWTRPGGDDMSTAKAERPGVGAKASPGSASPDQRQSAAMRSSFPPIADYGFLSDCHTGALVAPDGAVDWLCVPRFDGPSVFGGLLDREAGAFRLGPFGINVPASRDYESGTNVLETTWQTPSGWVVVRDGLTMGPRQGEDQMTPHTRPPADDDADHLLVRTVTCIDGQAEIDLVCEPVFDYGRSAATWTLVDGSRHTADASGAGQTMRLQTDMELGIEGNRIRARHVLRAGERLYCALSWVPGLALPGDGAEASATGTTATPGSATRPSRCRRCTSSTWTGRPTSSCSSWPTWSPTRTAACRSCTASTAGATSASRPGTTCPATPARVRCGSATAPSTSARTTSTARCWTPSCCTPSAASACPGGCGRSSRHRPSAPPASGASLTRASGRPAASRSTTCPPS